MEVTLILFFLYFSSFFCLSFFPFLGLFSILSLFIHYFFCSFNDMEKEEEDRVCVKWRQYSIDFSFRYIFQVFFPFLFQFPSQSFLLFSLFVHHIFLSSLSLSYLSSFFLPLFLSFSSMIVSKTRFVPHWLQNRCMSSWKGRRWGSQKNRKNLSWIVNEPDGQEKENKKMRENVKER